MSRLPSLAAAALTALVVVAVAVASGDNPSPSISEDQEARAAVDAVAPGLSRSVAAFRRAQLAEDRMPGGDPAEALRQTGDAQPGENPALARRLGSSAWSTYAWPMSDGVCYSSGAAGACAPNSELERLGIVPGFTYRAGPPPVWTLRGLARDGVVEVRLRLRDGSNVPADVRANAFRITVAREPIELTWRLPDGTEKSLKVPAGMY